MYFRRGSFVFRNICLLFQNRCICISKGMCFRHRLLFWLLMLTYNFRKACCHLVIVLTQCLKTHAMVWMLNGVRFSKRYRAADFGHSPARPTQYIYIYDIVAHIYVHADYLVACSNIRSCIYMQIYIHIYIYTRKVG
jgi:hypothetical protein